MPGKKKSKLGSQLTKQRNRDKLHTRNALRNDANGIWVNQEYEKKSAPVSILETNALEEFLNNAILAEKDFTAHKRNAQIVDSGFGVTGDLMDYLQGSNQDKRMQTEEELAHMLRIPRRPKWTESTTAEELEGLERTEFLEWRRSLAGLERNDAIAMSPFEKNLDVWRQLWRVIERSDVVVQIVDARNPLVYRCEDLELYIEEVGATQGREKKLLLLLNKADLISKKNRRKWARYFRKQGIEFMFWSANYEKMELEEKAKEMERLAEETEEYDRLEKMIMDNDLLMMSDQMGEVGASSTSAALAEEDEEEEEGTGDVGNAFGLLSALADEEEETGKGKLVDEEWGKDNNDTEFLFEVTKDSVDDDEGEEEDEQVEETEEGVEEEDTKEALEQVNVENELGEGKLGDDGEEQEEEEVVIDLDSLSDVHIYTRLELLAFFERMTQDIVQEKRAEEEEWWKSTHKEGDSEEDRAPVRAVVGMVGYPNVGKSSTINVLCHEKKVTVSATPGKTKHFQTHVLTDDLMLCDCPGLVFPSFMANKAEMIVAGVLPIDQMREHYSPVTLLCHRISRYTMERLYGIVFPEPTEDEDPSRPPTARELLQAYATVRGYMSNKGVPDESRAARDVLKDYINGVLLYAHPPPEMEESSDDYVDENDNSEGEDEEADPEVNEVTRELLRIKEERRAARRKKASKSGKARVEVERKPTVKVEDQGDGLLLHNKDQGKAKQLDRKEQKKGKRAARRARKAAKHGKKPGINYVEEGEEEGMGFVRSQKPHHRVYAAANERLEKMRKERLGESE